MSCCSSVLLRFARRGPAVGAPRSVAGPSVLAARCRSASDVATLACHGPSAGSGRPSSCSAAPSRPFGSRSPPSGNEAAATFSPASSAGSTDSRDTAASGSVVVASSQRPSQPVVDELTGEAVCQMAIERKWLRSACG